MIHILVKSELGEELFTFSGPHLTLGSAPGTDSHLHLDLPGLAAEACEIKVSDEGIQLNALSGDTSTMFEGEPLVESLVQGSALLDILGLRIEISDVPLDEDRKDEDEVDQEDLSSELSLLNFPTTIVTVKRMLILPVSLTTTR